MDKGLALYVSAAIVAVSALSLSPSEPQVLPLSEEQQAALATAAEYSPALDALKESRKDNVSSFEVGLSKVISDKRVIVEDYQSEVFLSDKTTKVTFEEYKDVVEIAAQYRDASLMLSQIDGNSGGTGTAFLISEDLALTNAHNLNALDGVVPEGLVFYLEDYYGEKYDAEVLGVDGDADVALLRLERATEGLPYFNINNWDLGFKKDEIVVSVGNAGQLGVWTAVVGKTAGVFPFNGINSALASINIATGASGSPVFGLDGRLKGIIYASTADMGIVRTNTEENVSVGSHLELNDYTYYLTADEILERVKLWNK